MSFSAWRLLVILLYLEISFDRSLYSISTGKKGNWRERLGITKTWDRIGSQRLETKESLGPT